MVNQYICTCAPTCTCISLVLIYYVRFLVVSCTRAKHGLWSSRHVQCTCSVGILVLMEALWD